MNDTGWLLLSSASGLVLGAFFFGGLWWTVSRLATFEHPALVVLCSLFLRTAVTLGGFFVLSSGHWQRLLACLAGFTSARLLARWAARPERGPAFARVAPRREDSA